MSKQKTTNEWEFQGLVVSWFNQELSKRPGLGLETATQETSKVTQKRNDIVIWRKRNSNRAFLTIELKTPSTSIKDPSFLSDAFDKAKRWNAPYFVIWNMKKAELYKLPDKNDITPKDRIHEFPLLANINDIEDWLEANNRKDLKDYSISILEKSWDEALNLGIEFTIDATIFVSRLSQKIKDLKNEILPDLNNVASQSRKIRKKLRHIAASQGFSGFVEDIHKSITGQYCYRLIGQILFYYALKRRQSSLKTLEIEKDKKYLDAVRPYFDDVRRYDYEALFAPNELDQIIPISEEAEVILRDLIKEFNKYDWNTLKDDVLGSIFEQLIPRKEQILLGQFYTPSDVADLILAMTIDGNKPKILDPGCGSGTFLLRGYQFLKDTRDLDHGDLLSMIWGFDISPFATELAVINLFRQDLDEFNNFPRIISGDFFERVLGQEVEFPPAKAGPQEKIKLPIPKFDAIVANPPYLRSQQQDDLDSDYKKRLFQTVLREHNLEAPSKTDLFAFFLYHAQTFLSKNGRIGFVTSSSWLTSDYGYFMQKFLVQKFKIIGIIGSDVEPFFTQVDQNTIIFIAEKRQSTEIPDDEFIKFISLKIPVNKIYSNGKKKSWEKLLKFTDEIELKNENYENSTVRIRCINAKNEYQELRSKEKSKNWSIHLRAPKVYFDFLEKSNTSFTRLDNIAEVHLGYKSLQNDFYYLTNDTIENYSIEDKYLKPIYKKSDLDSDDYIQNFDANLKIFLCDKKESDIRGTGALAYIRGMANSPANVRKQSNTPKTISEVLENQGGNIWYAPKAIPHASHIWLRKAFDGTYAPFIFNESKVVDQRCNYIRPKDNSSLSWESLAALFTTSIFGLILEARGSASMGGGALEITTTELQKLKVPNINELNAEELSELKELARNVWENSKPINWKSDEIDPSQELIELDEYFINLLGLNIPSKNLYAGIKQALRTRIQLAKIKDKQSKKTETADVTSVAQSIVSGVKPVLESHQFPETFYETNNNKQIEIDDGKDLIVTLKPFFDKTEVNIETRDNEIIFNMEFSNPIAELILRCLFLGRRKFLITGNKNEAKRILNKYWQWAPKIMQEVDKKCISTSLGTKYEDELKNKVLDLLGIHKSLLEPNIYGKFNFLSSE